MRIHYGHAIPRAQARTENYNLNGRRPFPHARLSPCFHLNISFLCAIQIPRPFFRPTLRPSVTRYTSLSLCETFSCFFAFAPFQTFPRSLPDTLENATRCPFSVGNFGKGYEILRCNFVFYRNMFPPVCQRALEISFDSSLSFWSRTEDNWKRDGTKVPEFRV